MPISFLLAEATLPCPSPSLLHVSFAVQNKALGALALLPADIASAEPETRPRGELTFCKLAIQVDRYARCWGRLLHPLLAQRVGLYQPVCILWVDRNVPLISNQKPVLGVVAA